MFNVTPFNSVEFNVITQIFPYVPPMVPMGDPNLFTLMFDTDVVPVTYIGEQHAFANSPWTVHDGFEPNQWLYTRDLDLYYAGRDGFVYKFGVGDTDNGQTIDAYYVFKEVDLGVPDRKKRIRHVDFDLEKIPGSILRVYYKMDDDPEWTLMAEIDQGTGEYVFLSMPRRLCRTISLKIASGYNQCKFVVNSYSLDMVVRGQHKKILKGGD